MEWVVGKVHSNADSGFATEVQALLANAHIVVASSRLVTQAERHGLFDSGATPKLVSALVSLNCNRDIIILKKWLNRNREYAPNSVAVLDKAPCHRALFLNR
jgi:hypothetical protein